MPSKNAARTARYHSDPEYRAKVLKANRASGKKRYAEDPAYRAKKNAQGGRNWKRTQTSLGVRARRHKVTEAQILALAGRQGGVCGICTKTLNLGNAIGTGTHGYNTFHLDHCHKTGKVRGLLCPRCNLGIGHLNDDPVLLQRAIDYLVGAA